MSTFPSRVPEPASDPTRSAVLGKSVLVKGEIASREDLTIDGEVEGSIELQEHRLTVGPNGRVRANVKARELVVLGSLQGDVDITDRIEIRKEAKMVGDIRTARIVIEDGAYFKGTIDIVRVEPAKPTIVPKPQAVPAAASAAPAPAASSAHAGGEPKR